MKNKAFEACLAVIEREGWKAFSFSKASQESTIPLHVFHEQFSSPSDVMIHLFQIIDQEILKNLESFEGLSPKDTLFDILISRFEVSQPYKPVLRRFWGDWMMVPAEAPPLACQGFSSMAWMLEAAGLESRGLKGFMRIQGLMTLYLLTIKIWLTDDSPDLGKTMAFLDKGLLKLERAARLFNGF
jgi:hypothetical protein